MQKIKLTIANRVYPLNVPLEQEEGLRVASKKIDIMIKHFEENYAVKDKQDVLAMCALQIASKKTQKTIDENNLNKSLEDRLLHLNELLKEV